MKVSYEYQGHKCPFRAKVWDVGVGCEQVEQTVIAILCDSEYPFVAVDGRFDKCEPIPEPRVIPWTQETAPFPLALRKKGWSEGSYQLATGTSSLHVAINRGTVSWEELADPDSEWETRDGKPCGEVVS